MSLLAPTHPGFFEVLATRRAYTTLAYLLLSLGTGILAFTYAVTGLSLSLGLAILVIGIPVALTFLAGTRLLAVGEVHLLRILVADEDERDASEAPALLPAGEGFLARWTTLLKDRRTWTSLLYFVLLLPLGVAYFTSLFTLLAVGLGLLAVPIASLFHATGGISLDVGPQAWSTAHPTLTALLCGLAGLGLLPMSLHLALLLGRFQVWLAKQLLVRS